MPLNWIDTLILVTVALTTFHGLRRGLVRSIIDLLAAGIAIFVAYAFGGKAAALLENFLHVPAALASIAGFTVSWIIVYLLFDLLGSLVHRFIKASFFAPLNLLGGALLGLGKGIIIVGIILAPIMAFPLPKAVSGELKKSTAVEWLLPVLGESYKIIGRALPKDIPNVSEFYLPSTLPLPKGIGK